MYLALPLRLDWSFFQISLGINEIDHILEKIVSKSDMANRTVTSNQQGIVQSIRNVEPAQAPSKVMLRRKKEPNWIQMTLLVALFFKELTHSSINSYLVLLSDCPAEIPSHGEVPSHSLSNIQMKRTSNQNAPVTLPQPTLFYICIHFIS